MIKKDLIKSMLLKQHSLISYLQMYIDNTVSFLAQEGDNVLEEELLIDMIKKCNLYLNQCYLHLKGIPDFNYDKVPHEYTAMWIVHDKVDFKDMYEEYRKTHLRYLLKLKVSE